MAEQPFKKINSKEYEIQLEGRTRTILVPFGKTEKIFKEFIANGGIINEYGEVQTDIISLIASFKSVGNLLLTEYDEVGNVVKEGNCGDLDTPSVIALFQLAVDVIQSFIEGLAEMQRLTQPTPNLPSDEDESQKTTKLD